MRIPFCNRFMRMADHKGYRKRWDMIWQLLRNLIADAIIRDSKLIHLITNEEDTGVYL